MLLKLLELGDVLTLEVTMSCYSLLSLRIDSFFFLPFSHAVGYPPQVGIATVTP